MPASRKPQPRTKATEDTIDSLLDEFQVQEADDDCGEIPDGWFVVSNNRGDIAHFANESDACRFRLAEINRKLNP